MVLESSSMGYHYKIKYTNESKAKNILRLIVGSVGCGKSVIQERLIENFLREGYCVIYVSDFKDRLEGAFAMFEPREVYHLKSLAKYGSIPMKYDVKLWHPFTFNIPRTLIPETNFFTISMKSLADTDIKFFLEDERETTTFEMMENVINSLSKGDGMVEYLHKINKSRKRLYKKVGDEILYTADESTFYLEGVKTGTKKEMDNVFTLFEKIGRHYFFMPDNYERNLDMKEILKDNGKIHVFTTRYIKERKIKDFIILWVLNQIRENVDSAKKGVVVVFDELKTLCPKKPKGHKLLLRNTIKDFLALMRVSNVSVIAGTQVYSKTDDEVISLFSEVLIGGTASGDDLNYMAVSYKLSREDIIIIQRLNTGEFIPLKEKDSVKYAHYKRCRMPRHMHHEEGYVFDRIFKEEYPDKMTDYKGLVEEVKEIKRKEFEIAKNRYESLLKHKEQEIIERIREKESKNSDKEELEKLKQERKQEKEQDTSKRDELIMELHKNGLSFRQIAKELTDNHSIKISHMAISKIIKKKDVT